MLDAKLLVVGVITVIKIILFRHREVFCVLIGRSCSISVRSDLRPETGATGSGPADCLVSVDKLFHWQKSRLFFFPFFFSFCVFVFVCPPNVPDGPLFKSCYLSYWEGMKRRPAVSWSSMRRKPLRSGKISQEVCGIPARWASGPPFPVFRPCWKFRENSAWMKTRSIFTFPLKRVSVLSSSQAYHLPLQTHLGISLATRRRNMQKISEVEDHVDSNASSRKSEHVVLFFVVFAKTSITFTFLPFKRLLFSFEIDQKWQ